MAASPPTILIVEDDWRVAEALKDFMESHDAGYATSIAQTGMEALGAAARHRPHLVILDLGLPDMDGLEVLQYLHALDRTIPVIVLSGTTDVKRTARALDCGAVAYAPKPMNLEDLEHLIALHLPNAPTTI
jgi:two-component system, OmpR family, KDP operon response regulator KdpE